MIWSTFLYRAPVTKDQSAWIGPATVVNLTALKRGQTDVKFQGHIYSCAVRHVRKALVFFTFLSDIDKGNSHDNLWTECQKRIQSYKHNLLHNLCAIETQQGWLLSREAVIDHRLYTAILKVALFHFKLPGCVGARFGIGLQSIPAIPHICATVMFYWHVDHPQ